LRRVQQPVRPTIGDTDYPAAEVILRDIRVSRHPIAASDGGERLGFRSLVGTRVSRLCTTARSTTSRPNEMRGTDGVRIETVDEGGVWVFSAADHCVTC